MKTVTVYFAMSHTPSSDMEGIDCNTPAFIQCAQQRLPTHSTQTDPAILDICPVLYIEFAAPTATSVTTCVHGSPVMDEGHCLALGQQP